MTLMTPTGLVASGATEQAAAATGAASVAWLLVALPLAGAALLLLGALPYVAAWALQR